MNKSEAGKLGALARWNNRSHENHKKIPPIEALFWKKVKPLSATECWNWQASIGTPGYGNFWYNGKNMAAHRASWIIHFGAIPAGLCICHQCDNRRCVNPNHLFLGSHADNVKDKTQKGRCASTPPRYGSKNHLTRIPFDDVCLIREQFKTGVGTCKSIAKDFGISVTHVRDLVNNKFRVHQ